jgi:hypothetical protein
MNKPAKNNATKNQNLRPKGHVTSKAVRDKDGKIIGREMIFPFSRSKRQP